jgi:hypothetical protein
LDVDATRAYAGALRVAVPLTKIYYLSKRSRVKILKKRLQPLFSSDEAVCRLFAINGCTVEVEDHDPTVLGVDDAGQDPARLVR